MVDPVGPTTVASLGAVTRRGTPGSLSLRRAIMHDHRDSGRGWEIRASLVCTLCARLAGTANGPNAQPFVVTSIQLLDSSHTEAVRLLRCPYCSGRLWLQDHQEVHVTRHVLTGDDLRPRRGRPRKSFKAS